MIDLIFLLLAPAHPAWVALAILQAVARRSPYVVAGLLLLPCLVGLPAIDQARPWVVRVLPGAAKIMSSAGGAGTSTEVVPHQAVPDSTGVVPPDTNAERTSSAPAVGVVAAPHGDITQRGPAVVVDRAALVAYLATLQDAAGNYQFSANKIADLVGGQRGAVLAEIAKHRTPNGAAVPRSISRPEGGW